MASMSKLAAVFLILQTAPFTFGGTTLLPSTQPAVIKWDAAKNHVGETITVTGPVMGTHPVNSGNWLILNLGKDYPDPTRLMILIKGKASEADYKKKKVSVTGKVVMYQGSPQLMVTPADVTIKKDK